MLTRIGALCGAALALLTATALAKKPPPPVADTQDVVLDLHRDARPWRGAVTATSPKSLAAGTWYVTEVQGTGSFYKSSLWLHPHARHHRRGVVCGTPEGAPLFASPTTDDTGKVGYDPETMFARVTTSRTCAHDPLPRTTRRFQIDPAHVWLHPTPLNGRQTTPSADHAYSYPVQGHGVPVGFRELDRPTWDNYGAFHIHVRRATDADCAGAGWRSFATETGAQAFANAAACEAVL